MLKRKRDTQVGWANESASETSIGETSIDETSIDETSIDETSIDETSIGEMSIDETSIGEMSIGETSISETSIGEMSIGQVNVWYPGETAFRMQRLIIQRYFLGELAERCTICLEDLEQKMTLYLPCKHAFHYKCWQKLVEQRTYTCPLCRANFSETLQAVGIDTMIESDNMVVLTIFTHMDVYDFMLELLWWNYELVAEREILAEDIFD